MKRIKSFVSPSNKSLVLDERACAKRRNNRVHNPQPAAEACGARRAWLVKQTAVLAMLLAALIGAQSQAAANIAISSPANGATVSGVISIGTSSTPDITMIAIYIDTTLVAWIWPVTSPVQSTAWNSATVPNGPHTLTAGGYGATGAPAAGQSVTITVANGGAPPGLPTPSPTAAPASYGGISVAVSGKHLVNAAGQPLFFHGVNRSGGEYACVSGLGVFSGPVDQASVDAMKAWHINAVRLPLNEDCALGINGMPAQYSGSNYMNAVVNYVNLLESNNIYVILDLHWSAPGSYPADSQEPMADADHGPAFWTTVTNAFANNRGVMFDLYNEPYSNGNPVPAWNWSCWAHGGCTVSCVRGSCSGAGYTAAGMGQLLTAVRSAEGSGWHHPVLIGGMGSASDLTGWLANHPADPAGQLVANAHAYNDGQSCQDPTGGSCLDTTWYPILASGYPLMMDEFGQTGCVWNSWLDGMMSWMETRGASGYTPWGWDGGAACSDPGMISGWSGVADGYGAGYRAHILTLP